MITAADITALIPAHNEADGIAATITSLRAQGVDDILAMCDNCTDDTFSVAHHTLSALVLLFAAMTLLTIVAELRHRHHKESA